MPVKNVCYCDNPPGGSIVCEPHQIAVCGVIRGQVRRECLDPPADWTPISLVNWIISELSGEERFPDQPITMDEFQFLKDGHGTFLDGTDVKFNLPESVLRAMLMFKDVDGESNSGTAEI